MKKILSILLGVASCNLYAGTMGDAAPAPKFYTLVDVGYYGSNYQSNFFISDAAVPPQLVQSFNNSNSDAYVQIGIGTESRIGTLLFDHQLVLSKLGGSVMFKTTDLSTIPSVISTWYMKQNIDFGYDWMPKIHLPKSLVGQGILGVHYARFTYQKLNNSTTAVRFNNYNDQIGFNLGAALFYPIFTNWQLGVKYQHWEYSKATISGVNLAQTVTESQTVRPTFNMVGGELRWQFA